MVDEMPEFALRVPGLPIFDKEVCETREYHISRAEA